MISGASSDSGFHCDFLNSHLLVHFSPWLIPSRLVFGVGLQLSGPIFVLQASFEGLQVPTTMLDAGNTRMNKKLNV